MDRKTVSGDDNEALRRERFARRVRAVGSLTY